MTGVRTRGESIRRFILERVKKYPDTISKITAEKFGITRQAVNKHLKRLVSEGALSESGNTRSRIYKVAPVKPWNRTYPITRDLAEDLVWTNDIKEALGQLSDNAVKIWHYGFTEMFNNAIDHSEGNTIRVLVVKAALNTFMAIIDDGIGIFRKIQKALGLLDERHAILELSKGKLTTDPKRHSGEGIFFASRMFDSFSIQSGGVAFSQQHGEEEDWIRESERPSSSGSTVFMKLSNRTASTARQVFDQFALGDDLGFNKTVVPVRLAQYGNDQLISRSQAKRLLTRVEKFKVALFDFAEVPTIGQAFADEIFRVFANEHPDIELQPMNASADVAKMIDRVLKA